MRMTLIKMLLALTFCFCWNCSLLRALSREIALLRKIEQTHTHVLSSAKPSMLHWVFSPNLQKDKKLRVMYSTWQLTAPPCELVPPHARASCSSAPHMGPWNTRHMLEEYKLTRWGSKSLWNKVLQERSDSYNKNTHKISLINILIQKLGTYTPDNRNHLQATIIRTFLWRMYKSHLKMWLAPLAYKVLKMEAESCPKTHTERKNTFKKTHSTCNN